MSDSNKTLKDSYGSPLVWIFTLDDKSIYLPNEYGESINLNQLVSNFKYKYDEENDDVCKITIRVVKPSQLDSVHFKEDAPLKVRWGYLLPGGGILKSPTRLVAVREIERNYTAEGITLELICTDYISYLKNMRMTTTSVHDNFEDWLREIAQDNFVATVTTKSKVKVLTKSFMQDITDKTDINYILNNTPSSNALNIAETNNFDTEQNEKKPETLKSTSSFAYVMEDGKRFKGKSKAIDQEIRDRLASSPDGPYHIDSRDDKLNILKRDFEQPIYVSYTYAGAHGELIEFKPKSNLVTSGDSELESNYVNPENKRIETNKTSKPVGHNEIPEGLTPFDILRYFGKLKRIWDYNLLNPNNQIDVKTVTFEKAVGTGDYANAANPDGNTRVAFKFKERLTKKYSAKSIIMSSFFKKIQRADFMDNYLTKKIERKYEGTARVIGDPSLVCSKIYYMGNLAKDDIGNWYCASVEHEIDTSKGYTCKLELLKKPKVVAKIVEKRDYPLGEGKASKPEYEESQYNYKENPLGLNTNNSADDIFNRLSTLESYQGEQQYGNDIAFEPKADVNNIVVKTDSKEV